MLAAVINEPLGFIKDKSLLPKTSAGSIAGMFVTGTILVISQHSPLLGPCLMGLSYLLGLSVVYIVHKRFAARDQQQTH